MWMTSLCIFLGWQLKSSSCRKCSLAMLSKSAPAQESSAHPLRLHSLSKLQVRPQTSLWRTTSLKRCRGDDCSQVPRATSWTASHHPNSQIEGCSQYLLSECPLSVGKTLMRRRRFTERSDGKASLLPHLATDLLLMGVCMTSHLF